MFQRSTPPTLHAICTLSMAIAGCSRGPLDAGREPMAEGPDAAIAEASAVRDAGASPTATPDCAPREYLATTASGARRCVALTVCGDDEYERFAPTPTTDRVCAPVTRCTAREYESAPPRPGRNRVCMPLTTCAASQYEVEAATSTTDRRCARLTDCRRGEYVEIQPTATRDRVCAACPPGTFSDRDNADACAAWTECSQDRWIVEGTATSDRECECLAGSAGVLEGDVEAESQAEVDALLGIREVTGRLRIPGLVSAPQGFVAADTTSLEALWCLERVGDALMVTDHRNLTTLVGLGRLQRVGSLTVDSNLALTSLDGLEALTEADSVGVRDNDALTSLGALAGLSVVRTGVYVQNDDALVDLDGLHHLEAVGTLMITGNQALTSLSALSALTTVRGNLEISSNFELTSLTGLEGVEAVGAKLTIFSNSAITSLEGLDNVTRLGSALRVGYNPALESLDGLERLTSIGQDVLSSENGLSIYGNQTLTSLAGLDALQTLVGPLFIYNDAALSRCDAEALATRLGTTCSSTSGYWQCSGVCTCDGNLNDVTCGN